MEKVNLDCLSNAELISRLESLVLNEKETTTEIIRHLAEVDRRRLYAVEGYSSLFDYATKRLGYSDSSATRRIKVARAAVKLPKLFCYLEEEKVTLSSLNACTDLLLGENGCKVLEELKGKSKEEAQWLTASYQSVSTIRDRIQKVVVGHLPAAQKDLFISDEFSRYNRREVEEKYKFSFAASSEFMDKLERVQEILFTGKREDIQLEKVFGEALDLMIERYCPKERQKRREVRQAKKESAVEIKQAKSSNDSRYIPVWLRDEVLKRDNYRCSYTSAQGHKCSCPVGLEIDHIVPFAKGGKTEFKNLRVLCSTHNLLAEIQLFGSDFVTEKILNARE